MAVEVPGVDRVRFHDVLLTDPAARAALSGGSVTEDGWLILIADVKDIGIARRLVDAAGGRWQDVAIQYGKREFVETAP
ncbi:putative secreted protein [Mycobacteroides abscessus subsp. massiliense]|nr:putative secreted protein [Mycobacteroides abscessus subsp. massiliense]SLG76380.1 putative secreted protein [Mycobacteroides abscessus subsp. massiliense]SLH91325.1 putative secreted protein [Mycobacteroides abscessus subsp. massiliense]